MATQRDFVNTSRIWLIVSFLVLFFFVYQVSFIFSVVALQCTSLQSVWRPLAPWVVSPFWLFLLAFGLFCLWVFVEVLAAHLEKHRDRWFCLWVGLLAIICVLATSLTFRAHWEYYEVEWGVRDASKLTFQLANMGGEREIDAWHEFLLSKQCENPQLFQDMSEAQRKDLQEEFIRDGVRFNE